jgi:hypothetical protein
MATTSRLGRLTWMQQRNWLPPAWPTSIVTFLVSYALRTLYDMLTWLPGFFRSSYLRW